jgi:hypothetical protein
VNPLANIIAAAARDPGRWYWLSHCEGFAAISPDGQLGIVDCVLLAEDGNLPEALVLRVGIVRQRLVKVPIEAVRDVIPRRRQSF